MKKMISLFAILIMFAACKKDSALAPSTDNSSTASVATDNDPGMYAAIKIGKQVWMQKNLAASRYRNGDTIPQVKDVAKWAKLTTGAWCWYNNDSATGAVYGKLYNWYAVNDPRGLAPTGWHVSSDADWDTLSTFLGKNAGGKLKDTGTIEAGTGLWHYQNKKATNKSGFTALPGGTRGPDGTYFELIGYHGIWWTSTVRWLANSSGDILYGNVNDKRCGYSVRCLKD
ncbi:MAG TPA: fibrobacter succinogenes major paralogous domain-containing protein [Parafilimonas sp.]|nr:fibrobacter succinogenes major paralogous domain-containing protein [Parafilimonas sp.]